MNSGRGVSSRLGVYLRHFERLDRNLSVNPILVEIPATAI